LAVVAACALGNSCACSVLPATVSLRAMGKLMPRSSAPPSTPGAAPWSGTPAARDLRRQLPRASNARPLMRPFCVGWRIVPGDGALVGEMASVEDAAGGGGSTTTTKALALSPCAFSRTLDASCARDSTAAVAQSGIDSADGGGGEAEIKGVNVDASAANSSAGASPQEPPVRSFRPAELARRRRGAGRDR
jgi:hypothetical protein